MLKYINGKITKEAIENETTLLIKISRNDLGQPLSSMFDEIMKEYSKFVTTVCFIGGEDDQIELTELLKKVKKNGLKTGLSTYLTEESQINMNLLNELDFLQLKTRLLKKDYSPFGDAEVWIEF